MEMTSGDANTGEMRILYGAENVVNTVASVLSKARSRYDVCVDALTPSVSMGDLKKAYFGAKDRGVAIRYITEITRDNLDHCKEIMKVAELRNYAGLKGSFAISDIEYVAAVRDDSNQFTHCTYSNIRQLVEHHRSVFEVFWHNAVPAESRIREIEEGITLSVMEIIQNSKESLQRVQDRIRAAREEVFIVFSTPNAVRRQLRVGSLEAIKEAAEHNVNVRMLVPSDEQVRNKMKEIKSMIPRLEIRNIEENLKTRITILVIDRKESFIFETRDDAAEDSYIATGMSAYSNNEATGLSFASIFEALWRQSELYERLKETDAIKDEFINIAAHELRTPILPIMLSAESLAERMPEDEKVKIILRNANRVTKLTNNILDASRIESNTFKIRKERWSIRRIAEEAVQDAIIAIPEDKSRSLKVRLEYDLPVEREISFDRERIRQVLSNLLDNAIKFTEKGTITVRVGQSATLPNYLEVQVIDTGGGIDKSIRDGLFGKFVTKAEPKGSGLGLYLSKAIVEAHGGKIWAENNIDGHGATFTFNIPYTER